MQGDLSAILDALEEPVLLLNGEGEISLSNVAARELLGDGLVGLPLVRVLRQPAALGCVESVIAGSQRATANIKMPSPNEGTYRITAVALGGKVATVALALRDVSPLLQAAQQRSDFVANVSHELRSPLTTLSSVIETLQTTAADDPRAQTRFLATMRREADRMERLIDDLLSLSRVEEDERVRPSERVDLALVIGSVIADAQTKDEAGRMINTDLPDTPCLVAGDPDQLRQVFVNLLENALRYSEGDVHVSLAWVDSVPRMSGSVFIASVRDEGEGIAAEHLPRLTERFYRVDSGRSRAKGGTGLGLAIVKHIANRHRGRLEIASRLGEGTTMRVLLPVLD
jgi:two-component system phosphate regulon sensor histidine kinase PhoR